VVIASPAAAEHPEEASNQLSKAHFVVAEASRRTFGSLLIQWHESIVGSRRP